ncbi:hypothetical protein DFJ77DRAFT_479199 [Powellomyces hirtus]|nr:hypothetical protein DFJ77DRAFT_479199 [Powellomyces hirtus]
MGARRREDTPVLGTDDFEAREYRLHNRTDWRDANSTGGPATSHVLSSLPRSGSAAPVRPQRTSRKQSTVLSPDEVDSAGEEEHRNGNKQNAYDFGPSVRVSAVSKTMSNSWSNSQTTASLSTDEGESTEDEENHCGESSLFGLNGTGGINGTSRPNPSQGRSDKNLRKGKAAATDLSYRIKKESKGKAPADRSTTFSGTNTAGSSSRVLPLEDPALQYYLSDGWNSAKRSNTLEESSKSSQPEDFRPLSDGTHRIQFTMGPSEKTSGRERTVRSSAAEDEMSTVVESSQPGHRSPRTRRNPERSARRVPTEQQLCIPDGTCRTRTRSNSLEILSERGRPVQRVPVEEQVLMPDGTYRTHITPSDEAMAERASGPSRRVAAASSSNAGTRSSQSLRTDSQANPIEVIDLTSPGPSNPRRNPRSSVSGTASGSGLRESMLDAMPPRAPRRQEASNGNRMRSTQLGPLSVRVASRTRSSQPQRLGGRTLSEPAPSSHRDRPSAPRTAYGLSDEDFARRLQEEEYGAIQPPDAATVMSQLGRASRSIGQGFYHDFAPDMEYLLAMEAAGGDNFADFHSSIAAMIDPRVASHPEEYMRDEDLDYESLLALSERIGDARPRGLTEQMIGSLPSRPYTPGCMPSDEAKCTVCLSEYESGDSLKGTPCAHWFHDECLEEWLKQSKTCPICRTKINQ